MAWTSNITSGVAPASAVANEAGSAVSPICNAMRVGIVDELAQRRVAAHRFMLDQAMQKLADGSEPPAIDLVLRTMARVAASRLPSFNLRLVRGGVA